MNRIIKTLIRRRRAKSLGFGFVRISKFKLPKVMLINGSKVNLHYPKEEGVFNDFISIFLDDDYGLEHFKEKNIKRIIDIGANVGFFSLASRIAFPHSKIHAYEPNQSLSVYLSSYSDSLKFINFSEAIGAKSGLVELDLLGDSNQTRIKCAANGNIKMISLKEALNRFDGHVDLLKMDCEGSEWEILEEKDVLKRVQNITLEYHLWKNKMTHQFAEKIVMSNGFRILKHKPSTDFGIITGTRE
jgi:FkbM family methyltransferase